MIAALAGLLLVQDASPFTDRAMPLDPVRGGICAGPAWVALEPGGRAMIQHLRNGGTLFSFVGRRTGWWFLYWGPPTPAPNAWPGFRLGDVEFRHIMEAETVHAYVAELPDGNQLRIFGAPYTGGRGDEAFAARIHFGAGRPAACDRPRSR